MKPLLCLFLSFFIFPAYAVTSESYVDSAVNTLQNEIPAINANTVLTNTGTAGEIGTKKIYDSTQDFSTQTDALITAETFNAAVQNAIDNEYVCVEWLGEHIPGNCLLYQIRAVTPKQILPNGYTQLEYLEATGTQYINTLVQYGPSDIGIAEIDVMFTNLEYNGTNAYFQMMTSGNNCLSTGYTIYRCVSPLVRNTITQSWNGPTRVTRIYIGDELISGVTWNKYYGNPTYRIFTQSGATNSSGKVYYLKLIKNGQVAALMFPARRNSDNILGMYDMVSGTFFTNSGTGEFIAGPDVNSNLYLPSGN